MLVHHDVNNFKYFFLNECDLIFKPRCKIPWGVHTVYLNWNLLMPRHPLTNISQIYRLFSK